MFDAVKRLCLPFSYSSINKIMVKSSSRVKYGMIHYHDLLSSTLLNLKIMVDFKFFKNIKFQGSITEFKRKRETNSFSASEIVHIKTAMLDDKSGFSRGNLRLKEIQSAERTQGKGVCPEV